MCRMNLTIDLAGKIALVTGASQGIGAQVARTFHAAGAVVVLNHPGIVATGEDAQRLATELNASRAGSADVIAADVSKAEQVQAMMGEIQARHGGLDFLINNAAIIKDRTLAKMSLDEWDAVIGVNLSGVFHCCKYAMEIMRDHGAVVSFGSIAAIQGFFGQAARRNIRANAIAPGVIETSMAATIPENVRAEMMKNIPLARFGTVQEVANVVLFLCSPLASYVTGQTIEINGGWRG
jgi:3-oxoacyl-[acyl-carrier protein] reductase